MARYDLPTYVLYVLGHFWMFAVKITVLFFYTFPLIFIPINFLDPNIDKDMELPIGMCCR